MPEGFSTEFKNPNYPCDTDRPTAVGEYLVSRNFLERDERVRRLTPTVRRGRNATWRVETTARSFVVKQFRPWPANGRAAPAAEERFRAECQFYRTARIADGLGPALPMLLHHDCRAGCVILEDIAGAVSTPGSTATPATASMTTAPDGVGAGLQLTPADAAALSWFLIRLHHHSQSVPASARYGSGEVVGWQMAHLFPPGAGAGPWLKRLLAVGEKQRHAIEDARAALQHEGTSLVHGDFTTSNWVRAADGSLRVVDAEFSFFGRPEFDAGAMLGSMLALGAGPVVVRAAVDVIAGSCMRYHPRLTAAFAGAHFCSLLDDSPAGSKFVRGATASAALRRIALAINRDSLAALALVGH
jgi:5-methylthioribose kinase